MTDPHKDFNKMKDQCREEISQILAKKGPMWDELTAAVLEHGNPDHITIETLAAHMIGHRAAIIAAHDPGGAFFMATPSQVLACWAGWALNTELERVLSQEIEDLMGRLGFGRN
jgi:hypothetical protein